jgi:hypothetical protein
MKQVFRGIGVIRVENLGLLRMVKVVDKGDYMTQL